MSKILQFPSTVKEASKLIQVREQIQENIRTYAMDNHMIRLANDEVLDNLCQIIVDGFSELEYNQ
jgi:hypothetical protein|tara:strand:+ start:535 stop:729 length:195 start_codon:yes stop_codon:yes gene_type:complete